MLIQVHVLIDVYFCSSGNNSAGNLHSPLRRTYSVAPPVSIQNPEKFVSDWLRTNDDHLSHVQSDHAPLSPQSSVTSSGSGESHHDDGPQPIRDSFLEEGSGMRGKFVIFDFSAFLIIFNA